MSEERCSDCSGVGFHFNVCAALQRSIPDPRDTEITALRAAHEALLRRTQSLETALGQERAKVAALRGTIEACGEWSPNSRGKLIFHFSDRWIADDETLALLSGRGEGQS